jgi:surface antigen
MTDKGAMNIQSLLRLERTSTTKYSNKLTTKNLLAGATLAIATAALFATTAPAGAMPQTHEATPAKQESLAQVLPLGGQGGGGVAAVASVAAPATSVSGTRYPYANAAWPSRSVDPWGMYKRECVSYTAWKVSASGRHMPSWGGKGNANKWDENARAAGIPVDSNPRVGDVAIKNSGSYGHAMYVESVNANGTINVSQYNAHLKGEYSAATVSTSGLVFIHFN